MSTWTTKDGRTLDIAWMESAHLVHSVNLLFRRAYDIDSTKSADKLKQLVSQTGVYKEAERRGLIRWNPEHQRLPQLMKVERRETLWELCVMNACRELNQPLPSDINNLPPTVLAKATALRLTR